MLSAEREETVVTVLTAAVVGVLNRRNVELPYMGEVGSAGVVAAAALLLGHTVAKSGKNGARLRTAGNTAAAIAVHEFVEDSPLLGILDPS